jgi:hypothetical protein
MLPWPAEHLRACNDDEVGVRSTDLLPDPVGSPQARLANLRARRLAMSGLWLGYLALSFPIGREGGPILCPFRRLTARSCPLCGLTRSIRLALTGHWSKSLRAHPLGPLALVLCSGWLAMAQPKEVSQPWQLLSES